MTTMENKKLSFVSDITNNEIYRLIYENSLDLCRVVSIDGKIILCNNTYAKNLGYELYYIILKSIFDHVSE